VDSKRYLRLKGPIAVVLAARSAVIALPHHRSDQLDAGDVVMMTRLDRLARSTRDLLNTLATITGKKAALRSLADTWADTTTPHGRLM
jgi:hypothetical protein